MTDKQVVLGAAVAAGRTDFAVLADAARTAERGRFDFFLADGVTAANALAGFTEAVGLTVDRISAGMGIRSQRYSMLVDDGVIKELNVEPSGEYGVSSGEAMLAKL